jgi:hypothetical protein
MQRSQTFITRTLPPRSSIRKGHDDLSLPVSLLRFNDIAANTLAQTSAATGTVSAWLKSSQRLSRNYNGTSVDQQRGNAELFIRSVVGACFA